MTLFGLNLSLNRKAKIKTQKSGDGVPLSEAGLAWLRGEDSTGGGPLLSNAYEQVVWVYRAINALAEAVSNVPFLFSRGERGREDLITSGPLLDFYAQPHPQIDRFQYWELRIIWLMLRGECFRIPIYDNGSHSHHSSILKTKNPKLKTILILDPARFQHIVENHQLLGWRYTGLGTDTPLDSQIFLPEEVWFEKLPNPFDFWRGRSPLSVAGVAASTDFAAAAYMKGLVENNGDLGLIVRTEQPLNEEQQTQVIRELNQRRRRAGTPNRPLLLWSGIQVVTPQLSSADMQFLENRKFSRSEICAAFGVPEEIITTTDNNKYDVMAGSRLNFIENRVAPLCARLESAEARTVHAIDASATGWFDIDSLPIMQAARRQRLASAKTGFDMGIPLNHLNRILDLGLPRLPWGDTCYLPANYQPLTQSPSVQSSEFKALPLAPSPTKN